MNPVTKVVAGAAVSGIIAAGIEVAGGRGVEKAVPLVGGIVFTEAIIMQIGGIDEVRMDNGEYRLGPLLEVLFCGTVLGVCSSKVVSHVVTSVVGEELLQSPGVAVIVSVLGGAIVVAAAGAFSAFGGVRVVHVPVDGAQDP